MRLTPFVLILFFVCLNVSISIINFSGVLPTGDTTQPYTQPTDIASMFVRLDISGENLVIGGTTLAVGILLGMLTQHLILGGTIAIILCGINMLVPIAKWAIFGLPSFIASALQVESMDASTAIVINSINAGITALMAVVWFWFILGFLVQRPVGDDL